MKKFKQFFVEKQVLGLVEFFDIDGIGKVPAKLDSGNGAYNVINGQDIQIQGNKVFFRTENGKTLLKDRKGDIDINYGEGEIRPRPVVELDFRIGKKEFKGIPFSIADRSTNLYKILVGKDFIENHLDALIDVSQENIADEDLEAEY